MNHLEAGALGNLTLAGNSSPARWLKQRTLTRRQSRLKSMGAAARGPVSAGRSEAESTRAG
jgi:hypothetical protein